LYSEEPSRPNTPVNVLVSMEVLKAGFGWSDEEAHDAFIYNLQVRYALGYRDIREGEFDLRTLYNFRQRLSRYMQETGENLIARAFEQVADEQMEAYRLKTGKLRMDITQIASPGQDLRQHPGDEPPAAPGGGSAAGAAHAQPRRSGKLCWRARAVPERDLGPICLPHQRRRDRGSSPTDW